MNHSNQNPKRRKGKAVPLITAEDFCAHPDLSRYVIEDILGRDDFEVSAMKPSPQEEELADPFALIDFALDFRDGLKAYARLHVAPVSVGVDDLKEFAFYLENTVAKNHEIDPSRTLFLLFLFSGDPYGHGARRYVIRQEVTHKNGLARELPCSYIINVHAQKHPDSTEVIFLHYVDQTNPS